MPYKDPKKKAEYSLEYFKEWKKDYLMLTFRLHKESEADLIEVWRSIPDKREWMKRKLREYKEENGV